MLYPRALRLNKKGFTLVEVLVTAFILCVIFAALFVTLTTGEFSNAITSAKIDLQAKVRMIMDTIVKDVRQTNINQINVNDPSVDHIKFKKVAGIDNGTGSYVLGSGYIEYNYDQASSSLARNELDNSGTGVLKTVVFNNITQSPFYSASGVPLAPGGILNTKKLFIVIAARKQVRNNLILNFSLREQVKIRNE